MINFLIPDIVHVRTRVIGKGEEFNNKSNDIPDNIHHILLISSNI